jgi:hypothetical protein
MQTLLNAIDGFGLAIVFLLAIYGANDLINRIPHKHK